MKQQYLMEDKREGKRILIKTNRETTIEHLSIAGLKRRMDAIDIGCASGEVTREIAKIVKPGKVTGLDISESRIRESKTIDKEENITNIEYVTGSVYRTNLLKDSFDFVWTRFLFEYLKEPIIALKELKRITKLGGKVVVADIDGNIVFHYPIEKNLMSGINEIMAIINEKTGFDQYVGRKLYNYFYQVGFKEIKVEIVPYHNLFGVPSGRVYFQWEEKIEIFRKNFELLEPEKHKAYEWVFQGLLDLLKRPETLTYSTLFIVQGIK